MQLWVADRSQMYYYQDTFFIFRKMYSAVSAARDGKLEPMPDLNSPEMKFGDMSLASR
jgi:hypothetical protein